jgi:DNA-binding IclR family transcriptional regulator
VSNNLAVKRTRRERTPETSTTRRVTDVLSVFLDGRPDAGVTEISRTLMCSKSVVHRVLVALVAAGFVSTDPVSRRYRLGPKALRLGLTALAHTDIPTRALPYLRNVRDRTGETAILSVLRGDVRVYAEQVDSREPVRQSIQVGQEAPLHLGASGKAILAFMPKTAQQAALLRARGAKLSDGGALKPQALEADLDRIRRRGYSVSRGERIAGAVSVSAPVFDHSGGVIGSISAAGVSVRSDPARISGYGAIVRAEAEALSRELGWTGPARRMEDRA